MLVKLTLDLQPPSLTLISNSNEPKLCEATWTLFTPFLREEKKIQTENTV